jgi:energy-coupling factor transporter ATP-binding protein EcfA2
MLRAKNLIEAYNNFVVEPLKTEEEFRDFYVERPKGAPSPIEELKDRIENAESAKKYLFLGFRGCGKSTELNRLSKALDEDRFLIVSYSIRELDVSDFDFRDFFGSMALKIYDIAEKEVELERDIKEDFRDFMMRITKVSEEDITRYRELGISFSKFILLKLVREAKTR